MKKSPLLTFAFLTFSFIQIQVAAQDREVTLDPTQITVSIFPLMLHLEAKVGEKQSITVGGGLAYSLYYQNINGQGNLESYSSPFLTGSFRNYYTRKRVKKDNLKNNSGNYVGLYTFYQFQTPVDVGIGTIDSDLNAISIGPVWGIQRNYANGIHLDLSLGLGYIGYESDENLNVENRFDIIGGFEFGFRFNQQ